MGIVLALLGGAATGAGAQPFLISILNTVGDGEGQDRSGEPGQPAAISSGGRPLASFSASATAGGSMVPWFSSVMWR